MAERYEELFPNHDSEFANRVLSLCGMTGKSDYLEHESEIVRECFGYIESGKSDRSTRYLLRDSQLKAELPVNNEGTLSAAELHQLTGRSFSEDELIDILFEVELENKDEYSFPEADSFLESYEKWKSEKDDSPQALTLIDLKQRAEADMSLSQVLQLLPLCGLREQDTYTEEQAKVFVECSNLHADGKSPQEIAQHFGVAIGTSGNPVKQVVESIANLSQYQQQQILETLAQQVVGQQEQVAEAFEKMVYTGLSQAFRSGELQDMIDRKLEENLAVGKERTIQAVVETCMEERGILLPQPENPTLPSSSTN